VPVKNKSVYVETEANMPGAVNETKLADL
jgi:hypothetical protein